MVVDPGTTGHEPRPYVLTAERQARRLAVIDFPTPVRALGKVRVPRSFNGRNPQARRDLASALRAKTHDLAPPPPSVERARQAARAPATASDEVDRLRGRLREHPCHACPDREDHARWAERWFKLDRDADTLRRRIETRTNTVARTFDRVCDVLTSLGYLVEEAGETRVTDEGKHLMRIYSESDLVAAEALRHGLWDDLTPAELAAVLSVLVFESRRAEDAAPRVPGGRIAPVVEQMWGLWRELAALERDHKLDFLREPDPGFARAAFRWAEGDDLDEVLGGTTLAAGDFVRWTKQLIDLCGQVADAAGDTPLRRTARDAVAAAAPRRGRLLVAGGLTGELPARHRLDDPGQRGLEVPPVAQLDQRRVVGRGAREGRVVLPERRSRGPRRRPAGRRRGSRGPP